MNRAATSSFAIVMGLAGALLLGVQPIAARALLPCLGGSPAVWITAQLFFQAALVAGYVYAHALTRALPLGRQVLIHAALLGLAALTMPIDPIRGAFPSGDPRFWLLGRLAGRVGPTFLALSATAPLLQSWFAARRSGAVDPYPLYAASNVGSLGILLAYPFLVEPWLGLKLQWGGWSIGYVLAALGTIGCGWIALGRSGLESPRVAEESAPVRSWRTWMALAFVPSSLNLGVTLFLTTDVAPVPLLWVLPLGLYLGSFVLAFSGIGGPERIARALAPVLCLLAPLLLAGWTWSLFLPIHLLASFLTAWTCHAELVRLRPGTARLTAFYLAIAIGGALGGLFNGLVAPVLFDRIAEYLIGLALAGFALAFVRRDRSTTWRRTLILPGLMAVLLVPLFANSGRIGASPWGVPLIVLAAGTTLLVAWTSREQPLRFAIGYAVLLSAGSLSTGADGRILHRERNFFGVLRVTQGDRPGVHRLFHGTTLHGQQDLDEPREPTTYYTREGPLGAILAARPHRRVAVVGLGVGSTTAYASQAEEWTVFELDPAVIAIARDTRFFRFLADCRADRLAIVPGDARLRLEHAGSDFDLILLDAFSSDAPPVHLLTVEAFETYRKRLAPGGRIALNLTNRYLDLESVVAAIAREGGWEARIQRDPTPASVRSDHGRQPSTWAVLGGPNDRLDDLGAGWTEPAIDPALAPWTDDHSDLVRPFWRRMVRPVR